MSKTYSFPLLLSIVDGWIWHLSTVNTKLPCSRPRKAKSPSSALPVVKHPRGHPRKAASPSSASLADKRPRGLTWKDAATSSTSVRPRRRKSDLAELRRGPRRRLNGPAAGHQRRRHPGARGRPPTTTSPPATMTHPTPSTNWSS